MLLKYKVKITTVNNDGVFDVIEVYEEDVLNVVRLIIAYQPKRGYNFASCEITLENFLV